jgi:hypothetical protein
MLGPQQDEAEERDEDIGLENRAGIAGREIPGGDHVVYVDSGRAERE